MTVPNQQIEIDAEAIEAYQEVAEERGEDFKLPSEYKKPEGKEEEVSKPKQEEKEEEEEQEEEKKEEEPEEEAEEEEQEKEEEAEENEEESEEEEEGEEEEAQAKDAIRKIAVDEGLKVEEAKERYEARKNIIKKYKNDPAEIAKALQHTQSAYDKIKKNFESNKDSPKYDEVLFKAQTEKAAIPAYIEKNRDKLIQETREKNPRKTENMDDADIINALQAGFEKRVDQKYEQQREEMKSKASEKRESVLKDVSEADREFIPEVKKMVEDISDLQILSKNFDVNDFVKYVRGEKYTPEYIKQIKDEAFKRGQEDSKIVGEKRPTSKPTTKKVVKPSGTAKSLSERQKNRAIEMFPDDKAEDAVNMYKEMYKKELEKDPHFLG